MVTGKKKIHLRKLLISENQLVSRLSLLIKHFTSVPTVSNFDDQFKKFFTYF